MTADSKVSLVYAEDDDDHFFLLKSILDDLGEQTRIFRVEDGEELLNLLLKKGKFQNENCAFPIIILLDLNMPKKNGFDVLKEIKSLDRFKLVPIIMLTVSNDHKDIDKCYEMGADSFITKSCDFNTYAESIKNFYEFWVKTVQLPGKEFSSN